MLLIWPKQKHMDIQSKFETELKDELKKKINGVLKVKFWKIEIPIYTIKNSHFPPVEIPSIPIHIWPFHRILFWADLTKRWLCVWGGAYWLQCLLCSSLW